MLRFGARWWLWLVAGLCLPVVALGWMVVRSVRSARVESPVAAPPPLRVSGRSGRASVLFAGDTHFGESYQETPVVDPGRYARATAGLRMLVKTADLVVVNLETPLTRRTSPLLSRLKSWPHWADPDQTLHALRSLGVGAVGLANNHTFDALAPGLLETLDRLASQGIRAFGAGQHLSQAALPLRCDLDLGGRKVRMAVIAGMPPQTDQELYGAYASRAGPGVYRLSRKVVARQIQALKQTDPSLLVVVFPHWGNNYAWRSRRQAELGRQLIDAGADLVLGHGAHLFQELELYRGRLILYGLGNFVFLSPGRYARFQMHPTSLVARLDFTRQKAETRLSLVLYFLASDNLDTGYQPRVLGREQFDQAASLLIQASARAGASQAELERVLVRGEDAVGPHLLIDLGVVATQPSSAAGQSRQNQNGQDRAAK